MADHDEDSGAFAGSSFSDKAIRHAFIKKVIIFGYRLCVLPTDCENFKTDPKIQSSI